MERKLKISITILVIFALVSFATAAILKAYYGEENFPTGNVALIYIAGPISSDPSSGYFSSAGASSTQIVNFIDKAEKNPQIKAILFEINSPGGTGVASEEIAHAIKSANKTTVCYIREVGASGAYWAASACDHIFASRISIVGSVGVIGSYLEFSGLIEHYNITYQRFVSGKYKDLGSPWKEATPEERNLYQSMIDKLRDYFIAEVIANRHLPDDARAELMPAKIYTGDEALQLGLIDSIGGKKEAVAYIESRINTTAQIAEYTQKRTILDLLTQMSAYNIGRGIGDSMIDKNILTSQFNIRT